MADSRTFAERCLSWFPEWQPTLPTAQQADREPHYACSGCLSVVPQRTLTPYYHDGGNSPLCQLCSRPVRCDRCRLAVPVGVAVVDAADVVLCPCCAVEEMSR